MPRLDVRVVACRGLPDVQTFGKIDPYVTIEFEGKQWKTEVCDNSQNPTWDNAVFKFNVADENSSQLKFAIWNECVGPDTFLGQYHMSISGLTRGEVQDEWYLVKQCKGNAEIHIRVKAVDFGDIAEPEQETPPAPQFNQAPPIQQQMPMGQQYYQAPRIEQPQQGMGQQYFQQQQTYQQEYQPQPQMAQLARAMYWDWDVTEQVRGWIQPDGNLQCGPDHHVMLGNDPAPGVPKQFVVSLSDGRQFSFADGEGGNIEGLMTCTLVRAMYHDWDVTPQITNLIQADGNLMVGPHHHVILGNDPAPGVPKQLVLEISDGRQFSYADGQSGFVNGLMAGQPKAYINRAMYHDADVTQQVRAMVRNGRVCYGPDYNSVFGDPAFGVPKQFTVELSDGRQLAFNEGEQAVIEGVQ